MTGMWPDWMRKAKPRTFWEWVLVLFVLATGAIFLLVPLAVTVLFVIYGYE